VVKALTVQQPWAWAILHAGKRIENRGQAWNYRGPLAIHAGKRWSARGEASSLIWTALSDTMRILYKDTDTFTFGAIIGLVELVDAHPEEGDCCPPWGETSYVAHDGHTVRDITHLVLERPRIFRDPIPARGHLGLWTPTPDLEQLIDLQLLTSLPGVEYADDDGYRITDEDLGLDRHGRVRRVETITDTGGRFT